MEEFNPGSHSRKKKFGQVKFGKNMALWLVVLILLIVAAGTAAYYVKKYNDSKKEITRLSDPQQVAKDEKTNLLAKVGRLTQLPEGDPTIATVTDVNKLKDQKFFENGANGDKLLIYTKAKKAILYRPSTDKIINIAPLTIGNGSKSGTSNNNQNTTP